MRPVFLTKTLVTQGVKRALLCGLAYGVWVSSASAQLLSVNALGLSVSVADSLSLASNDSVLSVDVLSGDTLLGVGLAGQDILLLGAPSDGSTDDLLSDPLAPILDGISGDSSVLEFLEDSDLNSVLMPEVLTIELPSGGRSSAPEETTDSRQSAVDDPDTTSPAPSKNASCSDSDRDGVCDERDQCKVTPPNTLVLPNGCHLDDLVPLRLEGVTFALDTALLTASSATVLKQAAWLLKSEPGIRVEVAGHTDDQGPADYNVTLSEQRARAVAEYLIAEGVKASRLTVVGYGESEPEKPVTGLSGQALDAARAINRRVELRRLSK